MQLDFYDECKIYTAINTEFYDFYFNFEHQNFTNDYNIQDNFSKLMSPDSNCAYLIMGRMLRATLYCMRKMVNPLREDNINYSELHRHRPRPSPGLDCLTVSIIDHKLHYSSISQQIVAPLLKLYYGETLEHCKTEFWRRSRDKYCTGKVTL